MKTRICRIIFLLSLATVLLYTVCFSEICTDDIWILYPGSAEQTIAPGRDFYCVGQVAEKYADKVESASFILYDKFGKPIRQICSGAKDFNTNYPGLDQYNQEEGVWLMPDLVYDADNPDSFAYSWNKCYYRQGYVLGLISGGDYQGYIDHKNKDGSDFAEICQGESYTLRFVVILENGKILTAKQKILMRSSSDKVLARFSPDNHFSKVVSEAKSKHYRLYLELFPGYWLPSSIIAAAANDPYFSEIKDAWQYADSLEYQKGNVHFFLYNITETSACNSVELATLQLLGDIESRLYIYYMDIGEPELDYISLTGKKRKLKSQYLLLEQGDTLQILRVEQKEDYAAIDNVYNPYQIQIKNVDTDMKDGVHVCPGDTMTIFGIVAPIQNRAEEISRNDAFSYTIGNLIKKVCYIFTDEHGNTKTVQKEVALTRYFSNDFHETSIYEYAHSFMITVDMAGVQNVNIYALDSYGNRVIGSEEQLTIYVEK